MKKKICGIYAITNQINSKVYIGKSISIGRRWNEHTSDLNNNRHGNEYLQNAWNKYGAENFTFELVEECDEDVLHLKEIEWINTFSTTTRSYGYNLKSEDESGKLTEETRQHLREKAYQMYNRLVAQGYYTCILYNLNNDTQIEYSSPEEARANSTLTKGRRQNFITGEILIAKKNFTPEKLDKIKQRYKIYNEEQRNHTTKSCSIYAVNAYDFSDVQIFTSKTSMCKALFNKPKLTHYVSKVINTAERFRYYYFFSSEENMTNILPTCHKVCTREEHSKIYTKVEPRYKYILNHPDDPPVYLYRAIDAINYIPNATTKGIKKLITGEKPHYYKYTIEKISTGVEEIYS